MSEEDLCEVQQDLHGSQPLCFLVESHCGMQVCDLSLECFLLYTGTTYMSSISMVGCPDSVMINLGAAPMVLSMWHCKRENQMKQSLNMWV